jgi:hypothetical protein
MERMRLVAFLAQLGVVAPGVAATTTSYGESQRATWESPFVKRILERPFDLASVRDAASLLEVAGHKDAADRLVRLHDQSLVAELTGEPFEVPRTIGDALARTPASRDTAPVSQHVHVEPPRPQARRASPVPEGMGKIGENVWMQELPTHLRVQSLYVVKSELRRPISTIQIKVEPPEIRPGYVDGTFLTCQPDGAAAFTPGVAQAAVCEGGVGTAEPTMLAAVARRSTPFAVVAVFTPEISIHYDTIDHRQVDLPGLEAARATLIAATCEDKGTCNTVRAAQRHESLKRRSPDLLLVFAALAAIVAAAIAAAAKRGKGAGPLWATASVAMVMFAMLEVAAAWLTVRPGAGYEGLVTALFVWYSALPYFVLLLIVATGLLSGRSTRLGAFAATFGALVAVGVLALAYVQIG